MIAVKELRKVFRDGNRETVIIDRLTHDFPSGKKSAIIGRSGVGKSTLLHLIGCLDEPTAGEVIWQGQTVSQLGEKSIASLRASKIGFVFQSHHLLEEFSAAENVAMPLLIRGVSKSKALAQAYAALDSVGLSARTHHRPYALSGGESQRVAIARAIVSRPSIILADEPTGNLDSESAIIVQDLLFEYQERQQATIIVVTHNLELAKRLDFCFEMLNGGGLKEC